MRSSSECGPDRGSSSSALGGGARDDDEHDADDLDGRGCLVQNEHPEDDADSGFDGHQGAERGVRHVAQGAQLERER